MVVALVTGTTQPAGNPKIAAFFGGIFVAY